MRIGLVDVDKSKHYPNYALMKISAWHKQQGDDVEFAFSLATDYYDKIYMSKIFKYTEDDKTPYMCEVVRGGTGYSIDSKLPQHIDDMEPDYSLYPYIDDNTAYGFITRGCPNRCKWCVVPLKEGNVSPYRDVEQIAINGRKKLILMDNNILASDFGLMQIEKIVNNKYRVDFNQALDARLVTDDVAKMLAEVHWLKTIRFGCDTPQQIVECDRAMNLIDKHRGRPMQYLLYTMLHGSINECYERLSYFRRNKQVRLVAQPFRDYNNPSETIPKWQNDMARWSMRREIYMSCDFLDYEPRKNFKCKNYML